MEGMARFLVNIAEIGASGLICSPHPDAQHTIMPFCRVDFANKYRILQTEFVEEDDAPSWSTAFTFIFETVHDLRDLSMTMSVFDRGLDGRCVLLGAASTDLHTIATGPPMQDFQLDVQAQVPAGRIVMMVEMTQICPRLLCCISNLVLSSTAPVAAQPSSPIAAYSRAKLAVSYSEREDRIVHSEVVDVDEGLKVRWQDVDPITISGTVIDFDMAFIHIRLFGLSAAADQQGPGSGEWQQIGSCRISLHDHHPARTDIQRFAQALHVGSSTDRHQLDGTIAFVNGPTLFQMISGANTEHGVNPGPVGWEHAPLPANYRGAPVQLVPTMDRFAPLRASICWRAPTAPHSEQHLLTAGTRRKPSPDDFVEPLPRGWGLSVDADGFLFFRYHPTKQTTWSDPRYLPPGWEQSMTLDGNLFFYCYSANCSTWIDPRGLPADWDLVLESGGASTARQLFRHHGAMTATDPRGLSPRYSQHVDGNGAVYYKDHVAKTTTWDDPRDGETLDELVDEVNRHIDNHNRGQFRSRNQSSPTGGDVNGPVQDILIEMQNEVAQFQIWYVQSEKRWAAEKEQRERVDRATINAAQAQLAELRQKNAQSLARYEEKWRQDIRDKRDAVIANHEFAVNESRRRIRAIKDDIERQRQQWVDDMIEVKKFAFRDEMQKRMAKRHQMQNRLAKMMQPDEAAIADAVEKRQETDLRDKVDGIDSETNDGEYGKTTS